MSATRDFELGDILSITTGALVSRRHIDGVYDILNWMTGDAWLGEQEAKYGTHRPVAPLAAGDHTRIDPLSELGLMGVGPERTILIDPREGQ